jgi:hypothetical protein
MLIINAVSESRTLEYKEALPGNSDSEKYEFLKDVSSFANASGGDILYGVRDKREHGKPTGIPESAIGISDIRSDAEILRLENMIRDGIAPRITGIRIVSINGFSKGPVLIVRIPNSWLSPHMITIRDTRFYSRTNAGKYPLDVAEIRSAFALSESLPDKIRRFRDDRVAKIIADETPVKLSGSSRVILHILPLTALNITAGIDIASLNGKPPPPIYSTGWDYRLNFDGLLSYHGKGPSYHGYVQVFRSGAIEAVNSSFMHFNSEEKKFIPGNYFEQQIISALATYLNLQKEDLQLQAPVFVMLTLYAVKGFRISSGPYSDENETIDRDILFLPDIIVEDYDTPATTLLRPAFDALWQASGFERSRSYDAEGAWVKTT